MESLNGVNNTFNLAYTMLKYRVHSAILKAHLEPYLSFVYAEAQSKPSLICDIMEIYRSLNDNFLIEFCETLNPKDFILKSEWFSVNRLGKRQELNREKTKELTEKLNEYLKRKLKS
jgi:CRISPR/Cas system-associated endonuclease Cas1